MIKACTARLEDLQMKQNSFGWTVNRETCQAILKIPDKKMNRVWELVADGEETCVVMNIIFGLILFSSVKLKVKISMLFSFMRTRFEKVLTQKQLDILFERFLHATFMFFDIVHSKKPVEYEQLFEAALAFRENIEKRFGARDICPEDLHEWIEDQEPVVRILVALGTTDKKKVLDRLEDVWFQRRQDLFEMNVLKMGSQMSHEHGKTGLKSKRKFLPSNRKSIEYVLENIENFLPDSYKIQRCYRAKSVFKSSHIKELKRNFELLDKDCSGNLTVSEFCAGFESIRHTVKRIFARAKGNQEALSFKEFLRVLYPDTFPEEQEMMMALVMPPPQPANMIILDLAALFRRIEGLKADKGKHRGKIQLSEIVAVIARTNELYRLVIKWSRFERSRWDYLVTFEDLLSRLFSSFTQKEIRKMAMWTHSPPIPKLDADNEIEIQTQFMRWDADGSGFITLDELMNFLRDNEIDISKAMVQSIFRHMDTDCNKEVSYTEFKKFFEYAWLVCESEVDGYFEQIYEAKCAAKQPFCIEMI